MGNKLNQGDLFLLGDLDLDLAGLLPYHTSPPSLFSLPYSLLSLGPPALSLLLSFLKRSGDWLWAIGEFDVLLLSMSLLMRVPFENVAGNGSVAVGNFVQRGAFGKIGASSTRG